MPSITYGEIVKSQYHQLSVPDRTETMSTMEAAKAWASCGFYVLPIRPSTKNAGSVVGAGWPEKSSKDHTQIETWFNKNNYELAIHVGRSGAIAFDVDFPSRTPYVLKMWMNFSGTPFQSTRCNSEDRGHYLFATKIGANFSNSKGRLSGEWGEVRGRNGIIVVSPTVHSKFSEGGRYKWIRTGELPLLPNDLERLLPKDSYASVQPFELEQVKEFLTKYSGSLAPELLDFRLTSSQQKFRIGSRHEAARDLLLICLREAMAGLYPAQFCIESIANLFITFKPQNEWTSRDEFVGLVRWAVAAVSETSVHELIEIRDASLLARDTSVISSLGRI